MKLKGIFLLLLVLIGWEVFSQSDSLVAPIVEVNIPDVPESLKPKEIVKEKVDIYDVVDVSPEFPGGMEKLYEFLGNNVVYPEIAMKKNLQGKIYLTFIINEDGCLSDFRVIKGRQSSLTEEALRVLQLMPDWIPGELNGSCVRVSYIIPINFSIDYDDFENKKKRKRKK